MCRSINSLSKLDFVTLKNLESSVVSLYRIDKDHHLFKPILEDYPQLEQAEYIIYPNINNNYIKKFLDIEGFELLEYSGGVSEFILLPSDLLANCEKIKSYINIDTNNVSNYSW